MYCGCTRTSLDMDGILDFDCYSLGGHNTFRDVTTGATGATFRYLKPSQTKGGRFCPPTKRSQLTFSHGYVPDPQ